MDFRIFAENIANTLKYRSILTMKFFRLYTDGGHPRFRWLPRFRRMHFHDHWGLRGFAVYFIGREFNFVFGKDQRGFFRVRKRK